MPPQGGAGRTRGTRPPALLSWERSNRPPLPLAAAVVGDQVTRTSTRHHVATTLPGCQGERCVQPGTSDGPGPAPARSRPSRLS